VIGWETRVLLKHYLDQGVSQTALARKLGISRRTIHRWIESGELDRDLDVEAVRYTPRPPKPTKLDPYKPLIRARLAEFPELSAVRIFDEIKAAGYPGGLSQLKLFVRQIRPRPPEEPLVRFETPPGRQGQVDFAHFHFPWGRRYALLVVLGYSRLLWIRFYLRQDMQTLIRGLESAFRFFGGVPAELLFDQMKSVVVRDRRDAGGRVTENAEFLRFAHHWCFRARACRPYRAKTKGKVERPIRYVRESFVYGRSFSGDQDLNAQALRWLQATANVRIHGTTGKRPVDRFEQERGFLRPLALRPYRSLVLPMETPRKQSTRPVSLPTVPVEQRSLSVYARIVGAEA
jgi:transposase